LRDPALRKLRPDLMGGLEQCTGHRAARFVLSAELGHTRDGGVDNAA
jgi:hypothetical protein